VIVFALLVERNWPGVLVIKRSVCCVDTRSHHSASNGEVG